MRGAPQSGLAVLIWRIRSRVSELILGRPWLRDRDTPPPIEPEALAVPSDHGCRLYEHDGIQGLRPDSVEPDPEEAVSAPQSHATRSLAP
jgi:hypothetical protein